MLLPVNYVYIVPIGGDFGRPFFRLHQAKLIYHENQGMVVFSRLVPPDVEALPGPATG